MNNTVWLQIHLDGAWHTAARITAHEPRAGIAGASTFEYELDYAVSDYGLPEEQTGARVALNYPVEIRLWQEDRWPAFLLDIVPSGAGRRYHLGHLEIPDGRAADWPLLREGARNPVGSLRVVPARDWEPDPVPEHPGFPLQAVLERREHFLEYAAEQGAPVGGTTDVQGDAPKFLLTEDRHGRFHADGALPDARARRHWLVKLPRGRQTADDRRVLRNEAAYLRLSHALGFHTIEGHRFERDTLLLPRFDRRIGDTGVERVGLETMGSLCGVAEYGAYLRHERICEALYRYCTPDPAAAVLEYAARDALNLALGNSDNHPRNTAVLKERDGTVRLAPWYDLAPMVLDPEGIVRTCWWREFESGGQVDWRGVCGYLGELIGDPGRAARALGRLGEAMRDLPGRMHEAGVDEPLIAQRRQAITEVGDALRAVQPRSDDPSPAEAVPW